MIASEYRQSKEGLKNWSPYCKYAPEPQYTSAVSSRQDPAPRFPNQNVASNEIPRYLYIFQFNVSIPR
jgi:hypothetical protein